MIHFILALWRLLAKMTSAPNVGTASSNRTLHAEPELTQGHEWRAKLNVLESLESSEHCSTDAHSQRRLSDLRTYLTDTAIGDTVRWAVTAVTMWRFGYNEVKNLDQYLLTSGSAFWDSTEVIIEAKGGPIKAWIVILLLAWAKSCNVFVPSSPKFTFIPKVYTASFPVIHVPG